MFLGDLLRIEKFYHQEGYLQAKIKNYEVNFDQTGEKARITVDVEEGEPTRVASVRFVYIDSAGERLSQEKLLDLVRLKSDARYTEEGLRLDHTKITKWFVDHGYPYIDARVKPQINKVNNLVVLEWRLSSGPFSYFGDISYSGNETISNKAIRRGLGFRPNQPYAQNKLLDAQTQVYRLELFQFVSLRATDLEKQPDHIPIEVRVKESVLRTLKLGVGYGSEESFRTSAQWRHRNFLGGARIFRATAKHSTEILPFQAELQLSQPYFLSNRNDLIIKPFFVWRDEESFELRSVGFQTTLNRQLTSHTNAFVTASIERDTVDVKGSSVAPELADLYNKSALRVGLVHNSTNQLFSPTQGSISRLSVEEAGRFLRTRFKYVKVYAEHRFYRNLRPDLTFAKRISWGSMAATRGSTNTPITERFFAGGNYSVRGWGRQLLGPARPDTSVSQDGALQITYVPIGGNGALEGSFEFRKNIYKKISAALFLDYGNVWEKWDEFDLLDLHYAFGTGVRYDTLIGPVRLDFAWKLNKQDFDGRTWQVHFSIGQAF